jgi:hypothetical protein
MLSRIFNIDKDLLKKNYNNAVVSNYFVGLTLFIIGIGFFVTLIIKATVVFNIPNSPLSAFGLLWGFLALPLTFAGGGMALEERKKLKKLKQGIDLHAEREQFKIEIREEEYKRPYKLIESGCKDEFENEMNEFISRGFVPIGEMEHKRWMESNMDNSWTCHSYKQQLFNESNVL